MGTLRDRASRKRGADSERVRTPRLFQLGSTLGDAVAQEPSDITPAMRAIVDALLTRQKRKRGRPPKIPGEDVDTQRARVIYEAARQFPPGEHSIRKWIKTAHAVGKEQGGECAKLFPDQNLDSSVSRGLNKLDVPRGWNRKNLRKNKS